MSGPDVRPPGTAEAAAPGRLRKHTRCVQTEAFLRDDGFWDFELRLTDRRDYPSLGVERGQIPVGEPVHDIGLCVTLDDHLVVQAIRGEYQARPYHTCPTALPPLERLVGCSLARGWRRTVQERLGGSVGCAHIRDMLVQLAAAVYQTIPVWHAQRVGDVIQSADGRPPAHLGQCAAWDFEGPVVARIYPQFSGYREPERGGSGQGHRSPIQPDLGK